MSSYRGRGVRRTPSKARPHCDHCGAAPAISPLSNFAFTAYDGHGIGVVTVYTRCRDRLTRALEGDASLRWLIGSLRRKARS